MMPTACVLALFRWISQGISILASDWHWIVREYRYWHHHQGKFLFKPPTGRAIGGIARMRSMTPQQRTILASKAARTRWEKAKKTPS